ncbi:hypothetical protein MX850_03710 [Erysipelothrix sp. Poltava]|nr:hypothetical protein MX850_03710 [Erysipelothrix sp. Poltava]
MDDEVVDQFEENLESDDIELIEPEIELEDIDPFEVTNSTRIFNPTNFDDPLKTAQSPSKNIDMKQNESEQQTTDESSRVTLTLVRSDENQENIYQLLHKMNARGLLKESVAYKMNFEQVQNHKVYAISIFSKISLMISLQSVLLKNETVKKP